MAILKNSPSIPCIAALLIASCLTLSASGADTWTTFTSLNDIRQIRQIGDSLYVATSGGLLVIGDAGEPGSIYNNLNGLGTVDIHDVLKDAEETTWIAAFGRLVKIESTGETRQYYFMDNELKMFQLFSLADDGDNLWVGTELGLVLFSKTEDDGQIQDSYDMFGTLDPSPVVYDVELAGDSIWLATSAGIAVADKSNPVLLNAPDNWLGFGPAQFPQLGTAANLRIELLGPAPFVASAKGVYQLNRTDSGAFLQALPVAIDTAVTDLTVAGDSLFVFYRGGVARYVDGTTQLLALPSLPSSPSTGIRWNNEWWVAVVGGGLYRIPAVGAAVRYPYTGMPANLASDIAVYGGNLVAGFNEKGIAQFDGTSWQMLTTTVANGTTAAVVDSLGAIWVGTLGEGAWRVNRDSVKNFDENNSTLRGNNSGPRGRSYVVVRGLAASENHIFVACYRALNGHPVAFARIDEVNTPALWDSLGIPDGITDTFVTSLDYHVGQLAVGTEANGLFWCQLGPDPSDKSDDVCRRYTRTSSFLRSDAVQAVRFAPDGTLWVGTNFGLSMWDWGIERFVDIDLPSGIGPAITDIVIDTRGNVWASATNGLAYRDAASGAFTVYHSLTSGLVSDEIRGLTLDPATGDLYVSTSSGISVLESGIARPTQSLDSVFAFPNPFVIASGTDRVNFNFARPYTVRIFDVAGSLVRDNIVTGPWDGRNQQGEQVASGVYVFVLQDNDGNTTRGKILLINKQ